MNILRILYAVISVTVTMPIYATEYFCDPVNGSMKNDGLSKSTAWPGLESVISKKEFSGSDIIYLMSGNHGNPVISIRNQKDVTITKLSNEEPVIHTLIFSGASHWRIDSLTISSEGVRVPFDPPLEHPVYPIKNNSLIQIINNSSNITINASFIASTDNSLEWTKDDWNYKAWNGIYNDQNSDVIIRNCHIKNINFGIENTGSCINNIYEYNTIENFNGDGMRGHGTNTLIQYNTVMNAYDTNGNHDDLLQAFQADQVGLVVRGNKLIAYTDPAQPYKSVCQGIGFFDGTYHDFIIENNIIATNHWHGITLLGAENCKVVNNTVVDLDNNDDPVPWIMIANHKNGTPSSNCIIRNNICPNIRNGEGVTADHNELIPFSEYDNYFVDFDSLDLHLKESAPAVDKGSADHVPDIDLDKKMRPQAEGFDLGAYELEITTVAE